MIRVTVDAASSIKAHQLGPAWAIVSDPYGGSSIRVNAGRYTTLTPPVLDGLVAYWPLADDSAVDLTDHVGENDLTNNNTVTRGDGPSLILPDAADLEADSSQFLSIIDNAVLSMGDVDFAIAAWVQLESAAALRGAVSKWTLLGNQREYSVEYDSSTNRLAFTVSSGGGAGTQTIVRATSFGVSTATWYFVVAQHDAANDLITIQVDAGEVHSEAHSGGAFDGTSALHIGQESTASSRFWDGLIAHVGIWKGRNLSQGEIAWLYNEGDGRDLTQVA